MNTPSFDNIMSVEAEDGYPVIIEADLQSGAAKRAAEYLAHNWEMAASLGESWSELVTDVDTVIAILDQWKVRCLHEFGR